MVSVRIEGPPRADLCLRRASESAAPRAITDRLASTLPDTALRREALSDADARM
jgi:hypothetical protein